jgi:hypothetical protein
MLVEYTLIIYQQDVVFYALRHKDHEAKLALALRRLPFPTRRILDL